MSDNEQNKEKTGVNKDLILRIAGGAVAVILLAGIILGVNNLLNSRVDVTEGRSLLKKLDSASVSDVKAQIKELEKQEAEALAARKELTAAARFADTVIIGDGSVKGLADYCGLVRVLSISEAEVSGVDSTSTSSLQIQSSKKTKTQTRPEKSSAEEGSEEMVDGIENNYGIEGNQETPQVYTGEALTLDTTYGSTEETTETPETTGDTTFLPEGESNGETQTVTVDKTINNQLITAIKANPSKLFLAYGYNDILTTDGNADTFAQSYRTVLSMVKEKLPDCQVYVLSILPVRQNVVDETPAYAAVKDFNTQLAAICREMHATFINNTDLVNADDYQPDGITLSEDFYQRLLTQLEEIGDL